MSRPIAYDERPELDSVGGWVKSPIPAQNLLRVSNKEWIRIATGKWSDRRTAEPEILGLSRRAP